MELERDRLVPGDVARAVRAEYEERAKRLESDLERRYAGDAGLRGEEKVFVWRHLLGAEWDAIAEAHRRGIIDERERDRLREEIDARLAREME